MSRARATAARLVTPRGLPAGDARALALLLDHDEAPLRDPTPAELAAAMAWPAVAPWRRAAQRVAMKAGAIGYAGQSVAAQAGARAALLGDAAPGPPRVLVRVDEFPHAEAHDRPRALGTRQFRQFDELMAEAGVPYMLALTPRPCHHYLDPDAVGDRGLLDEEAEVIRGLDPARVEPALHGLTHRTRFVSPRRRSELCGLDEAALTALLDRAEAELEHATGVRPRAIVPGFNRFDDGQFALLARRYRVVCGGPESVALTGFHPTPCIRGDAVYLPSYPPLYGSAEEVAAGIEELAAARAAVWAPVVLHWGDERDDGWRGLRRALPVIARHARPWAPFIDAVSGTG